MTELLNVKKSSLKLTPGLELRVTISKRLGLQKSPVQTQAATWEAADDQGDTALDLASKELFGAQSAYTTLPLTNGHPSTSLKMDAFPVLNNISLTLQSKVPHQSPSQYTQGDPRHKVCTSPGSTWVIWKSFSSIRASPIHSRSTSPLLTHCPGCWMQKNCPVALDTFTKIWESPVSSDHFLWGFIG